MSSYTPTLNIHDLNDYMLLHIFKYLNYTDLWSIGKTCQRLHELVKTISLWYEIDARDLLNSSEKINFCFKNVTNITRDFRISANGRHVKIIPDHFFTNISSLNLTVLALENQKICGNMMKLHDFPESLIELSLKKTYVSNTSDMKRCYGDRLKNLKVLILDQCFWVNATILNRFQDLKSLEILSLYKCKRLYDIEVNIMEKFNSLRLVDCRFSGLGNMFLKCLAKKPKVQEIYFQDYLTTYILEKEEREINIANGSQKLKNSYVSDLDDIALWNKDVLDNFAGPTSTIVKIPYGHISNSSTELYSSAKPIQENYTFQSILYQRPYNECTCQNNPDIAAMKASKRKALTLSDEDMERKVCKGGDIYILKSSDYSEEMKRCKSNSLEDPYQNEKDIAVLEHTLYSPPIGYRTQHSRRNEYEGLYRLPRKCGNIYMRQYIYFRKYNDVSLKKLSLRGCYGVTDNTLNHLKHLNLSLLDVTCTRVTADGVKNFVLENVDCRVIHETMCICRPKMHF